MERLFQSKLNALRLEHSLGKIEIDDLLHLPAKDQAHYMDSIHALTHNQKVKGKETPTDRVMYYHGTHDEVGENCIKIYLRKSMKTKYSKEPVTANTYEEAAEALFLGWKNSPPHFKNMIEPKYDVSGLGFKFSADSNVLYAAQVFSMKPFVPKKGLESPLDAYAIKGSNAKTCDCVHSKDGQDAIGSLMLVLGTDSIYVKSENYLAVKKFFNGAKDGMYIDVVLRDQFVCANNNLLHGSPVYDGTMLKPVYFKELYKRNKAPGPKNFYAALCKRPDRFDKYQYEMNYGFIKNNVACWYTWPMEVPGENLKLLQLFPKWIEEKDLEVPVDTFAGELNFLIPFERGKTKLDPKKEHELKQKLEIYKPFIKDIDIHTFSSIEGDQVINERLQKQRAEEIKMTIEKITGKLSKTSIESEENWADFYKQIENGRFSYLKTKSHAEIKQLLKQPVFLDSIDPLIRKTRTARISVKLEAIIDGKSPPQLIIGSYKKAIASGDSLKAFAYQNRLLQALFASQLTNADITGVDIPYKKKFLRIWTNKIAMVTFDPELTYTHETRDMALEAQRIDSTHKPLQFNLCIMTLKFLNDYGDTIMPIKKLERIMKYCESLGPDDSVLVAKMWLNYHVISAYQNWWTHQYDKIDDHLKEIRKYFESGFISEREALKLGLLFNFYGRTWWTVDLLYPFIKKGTNNEDLLYLFVKTYTGNNSNKIPEAEWIGYLDKARKMNENRFFNWVDKETFQLMRIPLLKKEFCQIQQSRK